MKGLFDEEGRKKAAHVVVFGSEQPPFIRLRDEKGNSTDVEVAHTPQAIERRIEELLRRISEKVKPIGGS